jgi:hypothetical protein
MIPCDLALLAIGFDGAERGPLLDDLGVTRAYLTGVSSLPAPVRPGVRPLSRG